MAAGGKYGPTANKSYYLYRSGYWYWSLSPYYIGATNNAYMFYVVANGRLSNYYVNNSTGAVAPVINLSAEYTNTLIGTGTMIDPFRASDVTP